MNRAFTPRRVSQLEDFVTVLADGYLASSFADGPLLQAMRAGALLYLEEFNRVPEETLNVLITVLTEGEIAVPRLGTVRAGRNTGRCGAVACATFASASMVAAISLEAILK